jgi:uncharacterized membrane protein
MVPAPVGGFRDELRRFFLTFRNESRAARLALVDALRGIAILCMVGYHLCWDLSYLGLWAIDVPTEPGWIFFQRSILFSFLFLTGVSLVLGHREGIRWGAFRRRLLILAAAAAAMSIGTYVLFQDAFAFFGILHAIVLFSLMGLLFLRAPVWLTLLAALAFIAPAILFHSDAFNVRWLAWIGFWTVPPRTADLVAVFPWFGATLVGIATARLAQRVGLFEWMAGWRGVSNPAIRVLAFAGRWSLLIYLLHQMALLGVLYPLAPYLEPAPLTPRQEFVQQCTPSCLESGGVAGYCEAYCSCALQTIEDDNLWDAIGAEAPTPEQNQQLDTVIKLCRAMAE